MLVSTEVLELERALAGVIELADLSGSILSRLQRLMGASGTMLAAYETDRPGIPSMQGGTLAQVMGQYPHDLFHEDPIYRWNLRTSPNQFIVTGDRLDAPGGGDPLRAALSQCRPYQEFYRPHEIGRMCGVRPTGLRYGAPHMFSLVFATPNLDTHFAPHGMDAMRQLEVPLRSAAARIARFRELQHKQNVLHELLERRGGAFAVWDGNGRLTWMSSDAAALLGSGIARRDLEHAAAVALRQLRRVDPSTLTGDRLLGRPCPLRSAPGYPLLVHFSWITANDCRPWLLAELETARQANALLARLTPAESRILRLLARALSNREIAERLGVSGETVKSHLKHIFAKLGVDSRAEAVRLASGEWKGRATDAREAPKG